MTERELGEPRLRRLEELLEAVNELLDNAPVDYNDRPYIDECLQGEFEDLVAARKRYYEQTSEASGSP
jgi:hypothetical protein